MEIRREKNNKSFKYFNIKTNNLIKDICLIDYINSLKIPPAWEDVLISKNKNSKVLAEGRDNKKRIQKIYHKNQQLKRQKKYYCLLRNFIKKLPLLYKDINSNLKKKKINKDVLISLIIKIIMYCNFRVGNIKYLKDNNSYGITTIKKKHIKFDNDNNNKLTIDFIGKKQVQNICNINDKNVSELIKKLYNQKNISIFSYKKINITSKNINNFLKKYDKNITAKMFRTLKANLTLINELESKPIDDTISKRKKIMRETVKKIANDLHHTPAVCSKDYLIKDLKDLYIENPNKYNKIISKNFVNHNQLNKADYSLLSFLNIYCN